MNTDKKASNWLRVFVLFMGWLMVMMLLTAGAAAEEAQKEEPYSGVNDNMYLSDRLDAMDASIIQLPGKTWTLHSGLEKLKNSKVAQLTGEDSINHTASRFDVGGTDLGSMAMIGEKVFMFCGDTFSTTASNTDPNWRSNVLFVIDDDDPSDGLTIASAMTDDQGRAREMLLNTPKAYKQLVPTVIPSNIFAVDDTLYCLFMKVYEWNGHGHWRCSHSGLARSTDQGETWEYLSLRWPGNSGFIQTTTCRVGDTLYIWGIPSGRSGGVRLMRVSAAQVEDFDAYQYFIGCDEDGVPQWYEGSDGIQKAIEIIPGPVGEICVNYNEYLGNFVLTYVNVHGKYPDIIFNQLVMREGVTPWGEWSEEYRLTDHEEYPYLYGAFMCPKYVEQKGKVFYYAMSQWVPVYNIMWMKTELPDI